MSSKAPDGRDSKDCVSDSSGQSPERKEARNPDQNKVKIRKRRMPAVFEQDPLVVNPDAHPVQRVMNFGDYFITAREGLDTLAVYDDKGRLVYDAELVVRPPKEKVDELTLNRSDKHRTLIDLDPFIRHRDHTIKETLLFQKLANHVGKNLIKDASDLGESHDELIKKLLTMMGISGEFSGYHRCDLYRMDDLKTVSFEAFLRHLMPYLKPGRIAYRVIPDGVLMIEYAVKGLYRMMSYVRTRDEHDSTKVLDPAEWELAPFIDSEDPQQVQLLPQDIMDFFDAERQLKQDIRETDRYTLKFYTDSHIFLRSKVRTKAYLSDETECIMCHNREVHERPGQEHMLYVLQDDGYVVIVDTSRGPNPKRWPYSYEQRIQLIGEPDRIAFDPTGQFLIFWAPGDEEGKGKKKPRIVFYQVDTGKMIVANNFQNDYTVHDDGTITVLDLENKEQVLIPNFAQIQSPKAIASEQQESAALRQMLREGRLTTGAKKPQCPDQLQAQVVDLSEAQTEAQQHLLDEIREPLKNAQDFGVVEYIRGEVEAAEKNFRAVVDEHRHDLSRANVSALVQAFSAPARAICAARERELAEAAVTAMMTQLRQNIDAVTSLTFDVVQGFESLLKSEDEAQTRLVRVAPASTVLKSYRELSREVHEKVAEVYQAQEAEVRRSVGGLMKTFREVLSDDSVIHNLADLERWRDQGYGGIQADLGRMLNSCPIVCVDARRVIMNGLREIGTRVAKKEKALRNAHAKQRADYIESLEMKEELMNARISRFLERLHRQDVGSKEEARAWAEATGEFRQLCEDIDDFKDEYPEGAIRLEERLEEDLERSYFQIQQRLDMGVENDDGQELVRFGAELFPKWEGAAIEILDARAELSFAVNRATVGPGVSPDEYCGDVMVTFTNESGDSRSVRLYESYPNEDAWRYGHKDSARQSYMTSAAYRQLLKAWNDWKKGPEESVHYKTLVQLMQASLEARQPIVDAWQTATHEFQEARKRGDVEAQITEEMRTAFAESVTEEMRKRYADAKKAYRTYSEKHAIPTLKRIQQLMKRGVSEMSKDVSGEVPEWSPHWVFTHETQEYLSHIARILRVQRDAGEGFHVLVGHAGTGKDVMLKMFAHMTNRPYYSFDCTKWTTEFELSEDIQLDDMKTIKVPSVVLRAIQTPGAILNFNEFNAMPEVAQIYLHALFDEKRSMTLKTSSGREVKAHHEVLFVGTMNEGYPGTNAPQMATASRMVKKAVGYPQMMERIAGSDRYAASEPMMFARSVDCLRRMTLNPDMMENTFVQVWNSYINQVGDLPVDLTTEQQYALDTILHLVVYGNSMREVFMSRISDSKVKRETDKRNMRIDQPFTLREGRRCSRLLSMMTESQRQNETPRQTALRLMKEFYVSHFSYDPAAQEAILNKLSAISVSKAF